MNRASYPSTPKQLAAGDVIAGKFVVEKTIGMGGMGQVVSARHHELGTRVAIKVVHVDQLAESDSVARFKREARAMAKLTSEHAVRVYDVGETETGLPFMIMEYLEGRDLGSILIEKGPLAVDDVLQYMIQAAEALIEAHDAGIIHRDLKPQNLFISKRSGGATHIRVLDFGLAKPTKKISQESRKLTRPGDIIGTSHYMAPEQIRGQDLDIRTDIWAMGACMYRLLTRKFPFPGENAPMVCACILSDPPIPLRSARPDIPVAVEAVINKCLEKSIANRYQNMRELSMVLKGLRETADAPTKPFGGSLAATLVQPSVPTQARPFLQNAAMTVPAATVPLPKIPVPPPPSPYESTRVSPYVPQPPPSGIPPTKHSHPSSPSLAPMPSSGRVSVPGFQQEASGLVPHAFNPSQAPPDGSRNRLVAGVVLGLVWAAVLGVIGIVLILRSRKESAPELSAQPDPPAAVSTAAPPASIVEPPPVVAVSAPPPEAPPPPVHPSASVAEGPKPSPTGHKAVVPSKPTPTPGPTPVTPPAPAPHKPTPATSSHYDHL